VNEEKKFKESTTLSRGWEFFKSGAWHVVSRVFEWGVPSLCYHCEIPVNPSLPLPLCEECASISWNEPRCGRCGNRCHSSEVKGPRCFHCKNVSLPQKSLKSFGPYKNWLRTAIVKAKYAEDPICIHYLRTLVGKGWEEESSGMLTFIPSHSRRLKERKARCQHLPLFLKSARGVGEVETLLERVHFTRAQVHLRGDERRKSKDDFFKYVGPEPAPEEVILFDDVWTTGATARQAASTLKKAGVRKVHIRVLAMSAFEGRT